VKQRAAMPLPAVCNHRQSGDGKWIRVKTISLIVIQSVRYNFRGISVKK